MENVTNLDYLRKLSKGNEEFVKEMIAIFLDENPGEMKLLEKGIEEKDFETIRRTSHKLKSTIPFIGLDNHIEKEVSEIEKLSIGKADIEQIKIYFNTVQRICLKATEELKN